MLTSSIPHAEIREPPQVAQPYSIADTGKYELHLVSPATTICRCFLLTLHFRVWSNIQESRWRYVIVIQGVQINWQRENKGNHPLVSHLNGGMHHLNHCKHITKNTGLIMNFVILAHWASSGIIGCGYCFQGHLFSRMINGILIQSLVKNYENSVIIVLADTLNTQRYYSGDIVALDEITQ